MLSREPAVDTGPKSASLLFEVLYVDPDFRTHPPSTGQADPGGSTRYSYPSRPGHPGTSSPAQVPLLVSSHPAPMGGRGPDKELAPFLQLYMGTVTSAAPGTGTHLCHLGRLRSPTHRCTVLVSPEFHHQLGSSRLFYLCSKGPYIRTFKLRTCIHQRQA